ncbi:folylpolyglutamate synthase, mitochondrial-like isoform X1 [Vespa crabro]|uniref:folylpolyglutamate synthase, mitochondrial-like isoform X1 n=2 Tax=Vespa crabro TaxID=7445 RepID=UPI001F023824|nr:folylpolyglutamate synthase, mitochondrial-like isoform X1 [Vespa crabro]
MTIDNSKKNVHLKNYLTMKYYCFCCSFRCLVKISKNVHTRHCSNMKGNYKDAIKKLKDLQSNSNYLKGVVNNSIMNSAKLEDTEKYLIRSGINLEQLNDLSVIHVAGTKGKGSVCAFVEAILRIHGFRTGFFSSPHLITVRERLRINGSPINETDFAYYFWKVYNKLDNTKEFESDIPMYFKFLTVLMFNVFLYENIDVAIIEVGIGGEYDCTNIVKNPVCVGITSLGLDHTYLLGNTIEEIAYQKSGIFKANTIAFTVPQKEEALGILKERAIERQCTLHVIPSFKYYEWENDMLNDKMLSQIKQQNASLAIQLAVHWMQSQINSNYSSTINNNIYNKKLCNNLQENNVGGNIKNIHRKKQETIDKQINARYISFEKIATALSTCVWPGRQQTLKGTLFDFYLDGAHTLESMDCCISWFNNQIEDSYGNRYLIFNMTGKRDASSFMDRLKTIKFHKIYFVPNITGISDIDDLTTDEIIDEQKMQCKKYCKMWGEQSPHVVKIVANNIMEVFNDIRMEHVHNDETIICKDKSQVLITGSLHLVGAALAILDPNFTMTTKF